MSDELTLSERLQNKWTPDRRAAHVARFSGPRKSDPTPDEIRALAARIRKTWDDEEYQKRAAPCDRRVDFEMPRLFVEYIDNNTRVFGVHT